MLGQNVQICGLAPEGGVGRYAQVMTDHRQHTRLAAGANGQQPDVRGEI